MSYAYIHRTQDAAQGGTGVFHTRQLSYPVLVTVYHMLECHAMDVLSYPDGCTLVDTDPARDDERPEARNRRSLLDVDDIADWCLFSIEVRNTYGSPFEVTFDRDQEGLPLSVFIIPSCLFSADYILGVEPASTACTVPPGSTSR